MAGRIVFVVLLMTLVMLAMPTCSRQSQHDYDDELGTTTLTIKGQPFRLWVADEEPERTRGLMHQSAEDLAPLPDGTERGMIFIFPASTRTSFWMRNTIVSLDIIYLTADGEVLDLYTMAPFDDRPFRYMPSAPFRVAIEVRGGVFHELGVSPGDTVDLPASLLNRGS